MNSYSELLAKVLFSKYKT